MTEIDGSVQELTPYGGEVLTIIPPILDPVYGEGPTYSFVDFEGPTPHPASLLAQAINPGTVAKELARRMGGADYEMWAITRPSVQSIDVAHLYPMHGQFSDWEGPKPYPAWIQDRDCDPGGNY
jgi:hypothetical protein